MKAITPVSFAVVVLLLYARVATAETNVLEKAVEQAQSVDAAVQIISDRLEEQRLEIALVVDHSAAAASVGLELRPTRVVFARPPGLLERSLLRRSDTIGIDLPFKYLVFEDENGDVQLRANHVGYLIDRHSLSIHDFGLYLTNALTEQFGGKDAGLITVASQRSLPDTVQALQQAIAASGAFRVPLVVDYGKGKRRNGPVLIVFGNPNAGTPLMQATQEVAIDLPQKFLISENRQGVSITYNDPLFIAQRANLVGEDMRLNAIAGALANFASAGAGTASSD